MKEFLLQNIISLLCFIFIIITVFFSIKNYKQLKSIIKNSDSIQKTENKTNTKKNKEPHYYIIMIVVIFFVLVIIIPYTYKKYNELKFEHSQLQRLEKIDTYLLNIDEKIFMREKDSEELFSLHKELVSERENLIKEELQKK
ncbi:MAG: hypothetical protein IKZ86_06415 [Spirochaetaceae bacterium]|nr:hypothetical protein [Spirochaetaceae bacterium]